jgi:hypothetical protein
MRPFDLNPLAPAWPQPHFPPVNRVRRNRLAPRYINIATNRYKIEITAGANSTAKPKRNKRRRRKESKVDKVGNVDRWARLEMLIQIYGTQ